MKYIIGLDISKPEFHADFGMREEVEKFSTTVEGIAAFLNRMRERNMTKWKSLIGMEATGSYHLPVAYRCREAGYRVNIINPLITKKRNQLSLRRVKTDASDAKLVRICLLEGDGYPLLETAESICLKTLVRQRARFSMLRHLMRLKDEEVKNR